MVFVLPSFCWNGGLLALALQVDTLFQHSFGHRFYCYQRDETRDTQQNADASLAKSMVRPHVIVYMFAYALLGAATVMAIYLLFIKKKPATDDEMDISDNLVYVGLSFMTLGMLMGALWAKEAWGHYWAWDPKETWAAVTWFAYLAYVHFRRSRPHDLRPALYMLIVSFLLLQMCWWGINYLPSAQGSSVHTYNLS
jgi:cytochrome c biogenesis protein